MTHTIMQAPKGTTAANIEGNEYEMGKDGKIKVTNPNHIETLKRHGFVESFEEASAEEIEAQIDSIDDKDELVKFIEERGGEADSDMGFKKLRRLAREAAAGNGDGE